MAAGHTGEERWTGALFARAIYTAAKFGIADVLSEGPLTAEAIANGPTDVSH